MYDRIPQPNGQHGEPTPQTPETGSRARSTRDRAPTQTGVDVGRECRGQSTLVGALLLFGILVTLLVLVQTTAVPGWNQAIEVEHNERVQSDLRDVTANIHRVGTLGETRTSTVELGVGYPTRPFLLNPPAASGRLESTEPAPFEIRGVEILGVDNYWPAGAEKEIINGSTQQLIYEPDYNEHDPAPRTVYENGVLYNEIDGQAVLATEPFIDGPRISLVALGGKTNRRSTRDVSVPVRPESGPTQSVPVRGSGGDSISVTVPTRLPESEWEEILAPEFADNGGYILDNEAGVTVANDSLTVTLTPGTEYELELSRVTTSDRIDRTEPRYITNVSGGETPLEVGRGEQLTFEVRDKFNNPRRGVPVTLETTGGSLSRTSARTDSDGRVGVRYTAPSETGTQTVTATADIEGMNGSTEPERVELPVSVVGGDDIDGGLVGVNPGPTSDRVRVVESTRDKKTIEVRFENGRDTETTLTEFRAAFYLTGQGQGTPRSGTYEYDGFETGFAIPGEFLAVQGPTLTPGGQNTIALRDLTNNPAGDLVLIQTVWVDTSGQRTTESYFLSIT